MPACVIRLHSQIMEADAILIGCPEYNGSVSGALKNAIDWVSRVKGNPWERKPVAIIGCTAGNSGSIRSLYELKKILKYFDALTLEKECLISQN